MLRFDRSEVVEAFAYLDNLRESGRINMMAARPYLEHHLGFDYEQAMALLDGWKNTFDDVLDVNKRADAYLSHA